MLSSVKLNYLDWDRILICGSSPNHLLLKRWLNYRACEQITHSHECIFFVSMKLIQRSLTNLMAYIFRELLHGHVCPYTVPVEVILIAIIVILYTKISLDFCKSTFLGVLYNYMAQWISCKEIYYLLWSFFSDVFPFSVLPKSWSIL